MAGNPEMFTEPARSLPDPSIGDLVRIAAISVIAALVVTALYLGRTVLVPFALAILLGFILAPIVGALGRRGLPRIAAVICAAAVAVLVLGGVATFIGVQLAHLAEAAPRYETNLTAKIATVRDSAARSDLLKDAMGLFRSLDGAMSGTSPLAPPNLLAPARTPRPIPVEVRSPDPGPFELLENILVPLLQPLATLALVIVFVIFILLDKEGLRDRFISLAGTRDLRRTTAAIDEGADRLSRYLLLQTLVNATFGVVIASGLWLIGVPNPALWGLIGGIARFVPYVGVPIAAVLPLGLAFAVDPGWSMLLLSGALFFGTEAIVGQAVEPWLYGRQMGLSGTAVVMSAAFWTSVWGPVGLLLSTPLTMCLVLMGRHVEHLRFLDILLGDRAALAPEEALYLRLLEGDAGQAAQHAEQLMKEIAFLEYLDTVLIKGLALAQADLDRGALDGAGAERIRATVHGLIENLGEFDEQPAAEPQTDIPPVLIVAGRGHLDQEAAGLLASLLRLQGIASRLIDVEAVSAARISSLDPAGIQIICLSYLTPADQHTARYLAKRLRKRVPNASVIAGFWNEIRSDSDFLDSLQTTLCDRIATNLQDAVAQIGSILTKSAEAADAEATAAPQNCEPADDEPQTV